MPAAKRVLNITVWVLLVGFLIQCLFDPFALLVNQMKLNRLQREWNEAKSKWEAANIRDYSFEVWKWFGLSGCHAKITVRYGKVVEVATNYDMLGIGPQDSPFVALEAHEWDSPPCLYSHTTVPEMFDNIQWYIDQKKRITSIAFDPELGFLTDITGDDLVQRGLLNGKLSDTNFFFVFKNFQRLDPSTP